MDLLIAAALFAAGYAVGLHYYRGFVRAGGQPQFYQASFDAAVMQTCGHGFVRVKRPDAVPPLAAFLQRRSERLDCSDVAGQIETTAPDLIQGPSRYLLTTVSVIWKVRGISWSALDPLFGVFFGATVVAAWSLFRACMRRSIALGAALLFLSSPLQSSQLPHLRDYSKAPFIVALIAASAWIASRRWTSRQLLGLAAGSGVLMGFGLGFRTDLVLLAVPVLTALVTAMPLGPHVSRVRVAAPALFVLTFVLSALPVLLAYSAGHNMWHVIVLGWMRPFDDALGVVPPFYELGHFYNDTYVNVIINSYASRILEAPAFLQLGSKGYEHASFRYCLELLTTFPADALTRVFASIIQVLDLPFSSAPSGSVRSIARQIVDVGHAVLSAFAGSGVWVTIAALVILSARNMRLALWWLFALLFLAGSPALQFDVRHYFHLEVLGLLAAGYLLEEAVRVAHALATRSSLRPALGWRRAARNVAVFSGACAVLLIGSMVVARAYQTRSVDRLVSRYLAAGVEPVDFTNARTPDGSLFLSRDTVINPTQGRDPFGGTYLTIQLSSPCDAGTAVLNLEFAAAVSVVNLTESMRVRIPRQAGAIVRVFVPIYEDRRGVNGLGRFELKGIRIAAPQASCFSGAARVRSAGEIPLLLFMQLDPEWRQMRRYAVLHRRMTGSALTAGLVSWTEH